MNMNIFNLAALMALLSAPAMAETPNVKNCAKRDMVIKRLASAYGETRKSMGVGANNSVVEVFASEETGTWTIILTSEDGTTCLVASGQSFEGMNDK